jgi:small subunit ribosomal protein S6
LPVHTYEGMFILDSNRFSRDPGGISGQISQMVQRVGGEVLASRLWEERRLAYAIDGHRKGTYWLTYFKLDSGQVTPLNRECQLNENILRALVLKIDSRIAEALVSHALSAPEVTRSEPSRPRGIPPAPTRPAPVEEELEAETVGEEV